MDIKESRNYMGSRFLLTDFNLEKKQLLNHNGVLGTYGVYSPLKDVMTKTYFDTSDNFFQQKGISISTNIYSNRKNGDLIIRYDSTISRIQFLSHIPDTFVKRINKKSSILSHIDSIAAALSELYPAGLNIDTPEKLKDLKPFISCIKKRERWKVFNPQGLKIIMSFERNVYSSTKTAGKVKLNMLELRLESPIDSTKAMYEKFQHSIRIQVPTMLLQRHSDLFIAKEHLIIK